VYVVNKSKKASNGGSDGMDVDSAQVVPMKQILQDLMNEAVISPDDPWVNIEKQNWDKPFISFLLMSGVAEAHPTDARFIKLQDFHL